MVKSLEQFVAEATQAYAPAKQAVETQLGGLQGQLDTANEQINKNYVQQQADLNRQRNMASSQASMQAAGSGGSFGGAANIANRKYYAQSFVPAQTRMQTNQANELAQARQDYENQRTNLNAQLASLEAAAQQAALQQYWAAIEAEANRRAQIEAAKAANPYQYIPDGYGDTNTARNDFLNWTQNVAKDNQLGGLSREQWNVGINNTAKFSPNTLSGNLIQNEVDRLIQNNPAYSYYTGGKPVTQQKTSLLPITIPKTTNTTTTTKTTARYSGGRGTSGRNR